MRILTVWNAKLGRVVEVGRVAGSLEIKILGQDVGSSWYGMRKKEWKEIRKPLTAELHHQFSPKAMIV